MAWPLPERGVLGVFAKQPVAGKAKTRLAAAIGPDMAAEVHEAMLLDQLDLWDSDRVLAPGGRRVVAFAPSDARPWFEARVPAGFALQPQAEGDLGQRMQAFFASEFEAGAEQVVVIGSDCPALDPLHVISAFIWLKLRDVVIGPATDGGYYLMGARRKVPPIFDGIDWSTPDVLSHTIDRLNRTSLGLAVLPPCYDVDRPGDLRTLAGHLRALRRSGLNPGLPRTEEAVERAVPRH
jgi:rSAM/selenodomain-associated transferase 1